MLALSLSLTVLPGALLPTDADARPGQGGSMGSRGSRTWSVPPATRTSPTGTAPMQQSITPRQPMPGTPGYGYNRPYPGPMNSGFTRPRHPFLTGFMGGMLGAGLFGLLSGHGFFGGIHSLFSFFWLLIQIALVILVVRWLWRLISGNRSAGSGLFSSFAGRPGGMPPGGTPSGGFPQNGFPQNGATPSGNVQIGPQDYQSFQTTLLNIQNAWNSQDIRAMQGMATPEMVSYFNQQLAALASRGARNVVSDVKFISGDLAEAWSESGYDYATVAMRYSLIDLTTDLTGNVLQGSSTDPVTVSEVWTFIRPSAGGAWLLSAIQQTR
ncbi:TIM44-like domain-containing protein [Acetobacter sp. AN02]|nr:TIM44-like domain-containing protein [Acetobacter sp. AN02]MDG6094233.1 TIM44-like domain-containing protein [Acetobacter sp. AN02]